MTNNFVHTHVHTDYSLLDGYGHPIKHVKRAKELGMKALAITDHNHLGGVLDFYKACKDEGIKPLLGVELYWTWDTAMIMKDKPERDKIAMDLAIENGVEINKKAKKKDIAELIAPYAYDTKGYHIILIAKNQTGWRNLVRIQSEAAEKGLFNGRYHCDNEMLRKYSEGIICTTACISSVVSDSFRKDLDQVAISTLQEWTSIFGAENVFCEIQGLDWDEQYKVNKKLINAANHIGIRTIATNDVHYTNYEDIDDHDTLLCIGIGKVKSDPTRMKYQPEFWIKNRKEMIDSFARLGGTDQQYMLEVNKALDNTNIIADMVEDIQLGSDVDLFSEIDVPEGFTPSSYLSYKCWLELYKYLNKHKDYNRVVYESRLKYELHIINTKGYAPYMLTVEEYTSWAKENGCPIGPGRGSAAGSLVLFLLGITQVIDPIQYGLLFSRFLTMDRTSPPDVDTDFCYYGRDSVVKHLEDKNGHDKVSHIGTYTTMGVKNGLKDIGRVLEVSFSIMNSITKKIDEITDSAPSISFKDFDKLAKGENKGDLEKYKMFVDLENEYPEMFRLARAFEGTPRNMGVHASGILVTPMPVNDLFPTRTVEGVKVTLYTGPQLEQCKAIKYDILGLKTVSVVDRTLKAIDENLTWEDMYKFVQVDDKGVFDMICNKQTEAVFQIESDLFKGIISDMQPENIHDITVLTSIGRPGPLQAGMHTKYNNRKNGLEEVIYPLNNIEDIVGDTFGTIVYQEQIMAIAKKVAHFDDSQADSYLRKALAKKKKDLMALCRRWLIHGKVNAPIPEGYDNDNPESTMYDPIAKYGAPILGGVANGYNAKDLSDFWEDMEGYASYLFNKSHAACYSYITVLTAYFKKYYPVEFFASVLSIQDKEEKRANYVNIAEKMGIKVSLPDINVSMREFTPIPDESKILFGLGSIKGVGDSSIDGIIENRPYNTLDEMVKVLPKKVLNKRTGVALIKSGCLDNISNMNRYELINSFYDLRKDKDDRVNVEEYDNIAIMALETETLGLPLSVKPWFDGIEADTKLEFTAEILKVNERTDKNGNMMAFMDVMSEGCLISVTVFARTYSKISDLLDSYTVFKSEQHKIANIKGKKDSRGKVILSSLSIVA